MLGELLRGVREAVQSDEKRREKAAADYRDLVGAVAAGKTALTAKEILERAAKLGASPSRLEADVVFETERLAAERESASVDGLEKQLCALRGQREALNERQLDERVALADRHRAERQALFDEIAEVESRLSGAQRAAGRLTELEAGRAA